MANSTRGISVAFEDLSFIPVSNIQNIYDTTTFLANTPASTNPTRIIKVVNTMNTDMLISLDGVRDIDVVPSGSFTLIDFGSDASQQAGVLDLSQGNVIWVRYDSAPALTAGTGLYVTRIYATLV